MFGKDKDKQKKKKEKMNGKAGHSEENYNVLYDNLAFPEVYAIEQKQSDTEETDVYKVAPAVLFGEKA